MKDLMWRSTNYTPLSKHWMRGLYERIIWKEIYSHWTTPFVLTGGKKENFSIMYCSSEYTCVKNTWMWLCVDQWFWVMWEAWNLVAKCIIFLKKQCLIITYIHKLGHGKCKQNLLSWQRILENKHTSERKRKLTYWRWLHITTLILKDYQQW